MNKLIFLVIIIFILTAFTVVSIEFVDKPIANFGYDGQTIHTPENFFPTNTYKYYNDKTNDIIDVQIIVFNENSPKCTC